MRENKRGYIEKHYPPILQRLGIKYDNWMKMATSFEKCFKSLVGNPSSMNTAVAVLGQTRRAGIQNCKALLS